MLTTKTINVLALINIDLYSSCAISELHLHVVD